MFLQIIFLLYYQSIVGYIITLILRSALRIGLLRFVKKKKTALKQTLNINDGSINDGSSIGSGNQPSNEASTNDDAEEYELQLHTNFKSLVRLNPLSPLFQLQYSKRSKRAFTKQQQQQSDDRHDMNSKLNSNATKAQHVSIISSIPSCNIPTIKISPLVQLQGQRSKPRTYILGILLEQLQFQLNIALVIQNMDNTNDTNTTNTCVDIQMKLGIGQVQLYLFSQGLFSLLIKQLRNRFRNRRNHQHCHNQHINNDDTNNRQMILYLISKLIGGMDILNLHLDTSIRTSSKFFQKHYHIKSMIQSLHVTIESLNKSNVDNSDHDKKHEHDRTCSLSVELQSFSTDIINKPTPTTTTHNNNNCDKRVQSISMEQILFSSNLQQTLPTKIQIQSFAKIQLLTSFEEIDGIIQIMGFIPFVMDSIVGQKHQIPKRNKNTNNNDPKFVLETVSINSEINISVFDDRKHITSLFEKMLHIPPLKKLDLYSNLSIEMSRTEIGTKSSMDLSVVIPTLKIICQKQNNVPGKLQLDLKDATFMIEKSEGNGEKELFLDANKLSFTSDCKYETDYILGVAVYFHQSIQSIIQKKKADVFDQRTTDRKLKGAPFQCLAISCKNLTLGVHMPSLEHKLFDVGIHLNLILTGVLVSITPPCDASVNSISSCSSSSSSTTTTSIEQKGIDGEANIEIATFIASVIFIPHQTIPTFEESLDEILGKPTSMKVVDPCVNPVTQTYTISGTKIALDILLPSKGKPPIMDDGNEQLFMEFSVEAAKVGEDMNLNQKFFLIDSSNSIHFAIYKSMAIDYFGKSQIVQSIYIDTNGGTLYLHWSPISQWFITSAVKQIVDIIQHYAKNLGVRVPEKSSPSSQRQRLMTNIKISSNDTSIQLNVTLGGTSFCDVHAESLLLDISNNPDSTWQKPSISCDIGGLTVKLNDCESALVQTSSFRFSDALRRASPDEIESYFRKKQVNVLEGEDAVVTGACGIPLLERFELSFGDITRIDMPPEVHLGKLIEDIVQTEKSVKEGLFASGMIRRGKQPKRKYQLMDIHFNIPMLDANFLERRESKQSKLAELPPDLIFGNHSNLSLLNRWRFHIKNLSVLIKRNTPPSITQDQLRDFDEDKSQKHRYGPVIQGGFFDLKIDHVMCVLHPLNMALPLGDIKKLKLTGLIYLASLHPSTKGLGPRRKVCVPVKYHHSTNDVYHNYDYGVISESDAAPPKIYYDVQLYSNDVSSNYGPILKKAIPALLKITQRFIPSPPYVDERFDARKDSPPPLTAWDNMRHQFHGQFSWKVKKVSFRWLLDTTRNYNWSLQLTTKNFHFYHSTGLFGLTLNDSIITVPSLSYHLLNLKDCNDQYGLLSDSIKLETGEGTFKRHSLLLLPSLDVKFRFFWKVPLPKVNHSSRHHTPFLIEDDGGWPNHICPKDRFSNFRSLGVDMKFEIEVDKSKDFSTWIALRADVLPWLTHRLSHIQGEDTNEDENNAEDEEELNIDDVQVEVCVNDLHIAAWFDEQAEFGANGYNSSQDIVEGVYLTIPQVFYILDNFGRNRIDIDGVQAALLDIDYNDFAFPLGFQRQDQNWSSMQWTSFQHPCDYEESNNLNAFRTFVSLHSSSQQIKSLDYLLLVNQINILDKSLEEILNSGNLGVNSHSFSDPTTSEANALQKSAPWTVLIAEMKLLWTLEIRDRVLQIVKDILYSINFMKVNSRGTPQQLGASDTVEVQLGESDHCIEASLSPAKMSTTQSADEAPPPPPPRESIVIDDSRVGVITRSDSSRFFKEDSPEKMKPISHLDYLLLGTHDQKTPGELSYQENEYVETPKVSKVIMEETNESITTISNSSTCDNIERADTIPTFDLHLSNLQIQFHSEKTGGSVILSMLGAYIEMKMFLRLFCKEEDFEAEKFTVETLLRRTEYLYTLYRMELYSLSNSVDLDIGLQWLGTSRLSTASLEGDMKSLRTKELLKFRATHCGDSKVFDRHERSFPSDLQAHDTKEFTLPPFCQKIMDPCTFTTLQMFHRPPIDLTKEELEETIKLKSISSLTITDGENRKSSKAIDHLELFIDELSFFLDSHQFSTTLDVIRNVLLEPLQPDRERFYNKNKSKADTTKANRKTTKTDNGRTSEASSKMEDAIRQWDQQAYQKSKKGREYLRSIANDLLSEIEEKQGSEGPSIRRIGYTLCRAKWRIASPDSVNDALVSFTRFRGIHDFTADGSVNSQITLQDFFVESKTPGSESMDFHDPTIIIKTISGAQRSSLVRPSDLNRRTSDEVHALKLSTGTSRIPAISVRMDALPRTVDGLTMYRHIEANVFPGVNHSIIVQLTKSLTKSFVSYFLGDGTKHGEFIYHDLDSSSENSTPQNRLRTGSDSSSDAFEISNHSGSGYTAAARSSNHLKKSSNSDGKEKARRIMLFGRMRPNRKKKKKKSRNQDEQSAEFKSAMSTNASMEEEEIIEDPKQAGEIVFVKLYRVGPINIDLSIAGFGRIVNLSNQGVLVPDFRKAYKIGASNHLVKKLVKHFVASLFSNGLDILRNKLGGNKSHGKKSTVSDDFNIGLTRDGVLSDLDEGNENENEDDDKAAIMLLTNHGGNGRKRLYTK